MDKSEAQLSLKKIATEASNLEQTSLVTMFEIDIGTLATDRGVSLNIEDTVFRFHNSIKLTTSDIIWRGYKYTAAPIQAEGFEINSKGVIPTPTLSIVSDDRGILALTLLKNKISSLGDIIGAKVTRRRTFAKNLDAINFTDLNRPKNASPDPNAEFPPDVYFINRKTRENKYIIEYELASILDLEGIFLPKRQVISLRCNFKYRGEGCLYEYASRKNVDIHGDAILPSAAPAVANENDESLLKLYSINSISDAGEHNSQKTYIKGNQVYILRDGIKYYFLAKTAVPVNININNTTYWAADKCSKCLVGCRLRWGTNGSVDPTGIALKKGELPFGGFPVTNKLSNQR